MLDGKTVLIEALKQAIANFDVTSEQKRILIFDNTEYTAFLTSFNSPKDMVNLSDSMIDKLGANLEINENKDSFIATIKFLKNLAELSKDESAKISLNSNQLALIEELKLLIVKTINKNEALILALSETSEETNLKYHQVLELIQSNNLLIEKDYDLIEEVVLKLWTKDNGPILNEVMSYLNKRNAEKLEKIYYSEPVKSIKVEADNIAKEARKLEREQEELISKINVRFAEYIRKSKNKVKREQGLANLERNQKFKEIFSYLGFNYDKISLELKAMLLEAEDVEEIARFVYYLKEKNPILLDKFNDSNLPGLIYLLTTSNQKIVEKILHNLTYTHNLSDQNLTKFINLITTIFDKKYYENFLLISDLIKELEADINVILNASPLFFIADYNELVKLLKLVSQKGAKQKNILEKCAYALGNDMTLIIKNLKLLEMYGFNLERFLQEKASCYSLLNIQDLESKLDNLIETGLNNHLHARILDAGNTLRTLIIKRVYYAFKNKMKAWGSGFEKDLYHELIKKTDLIVDEPLISLLIAEYPILKEIEKYRISEYTDDYLASIKRKTELHFGQKIISRLKFYRVFKVLMQTGILEKEAMIYALTYKTDLNEKEEDLIKTIVERIGDKT